MIREDKGVTPEDFLTDWAQKIQPQVTRVKPTAVSVPGIPTMTPQILSDIFSKLNEKIKGRFKLISAIRDVKSPMVHRMTLIDSAVQSSLWTLDQSTKTQDEEKYADMERIFTRVTGQKIDLAQGRLFTKKDGRRSPMSLEGGGVQSAINMIFSLKYEAEKGYIFGIEEPEAHSHPGFQRKTFDELKTLSKRNQIFAATHSPIFIDRADLDNSYLVKLIEEETIIQKISGLKEILSEIGARASDILFIPNRILCVEGITEKIILPAFAERFGIDLKDIAIVPVEGKTQARAHLKIVIEITRNMLSTFVILDADAKEELEKIINGGLINKENCHLWQRGKIEDYYPKDILKLALDELDFRYNLDLDVDAIIEKIESKELKAGKIDLGEKRKKLDRSWKVILAKSIARLIKEKRDVPISDEVRRVLERFIK